VLRNRDAIVKGYHDVKPGWTWSRFAYYLSHDEFHFVIVVVLRQVPRINPKSNNIQLVPCDFLIKLLGIDEDLLLRICDAIVKGYHDVKPGWTWFSLAYYLSHDELCFVLAVILRLGQVFNTKSNIQLALCEFLIKYTLQKVGFMPSTISLPAADASVCLVVQQDDGAVSARPSAFATSLSSSPATTMCMEKKGDDNEGSTGSLRARYDNLCGILGDPST
jgi:hypothetical protein